MKYAVIDNLGVVVNIILWDGVSPWTPPEGCFAIELQSGEWCNMGCIYIPGAVPRFVNPPEPME